jgi:hypothetical protein
MQPLQNVWKEHNWVCRVRINRGAGYRCTRCQTWQPIASALKSELQPTYPFHLQQPTLQSTFKTILTLILTTEAYCDASHPKST